MKHLAVGLTLLSRLAIADERPVDERAGFHVGGSVGGVYLPVSEGISGLVLRADFNWGKHNGEVRVSPIGFVARTGDDPSVGLGGLFERRWFASERVRVGVGAMAAMIFEDNRSLAAGPCATPVAYTFGDRRNLEVALEVFLLRNFESSSNLPGGYVSFTYLAL